MQSTKNIPMYILADVPGRGKGLVATMRISKGTRILSEEPIIITTPLNETSIGQIRTSIKRQVDALDENRRRAFLSMHNIHTYGNATEEYLGIVKTNGLPIEDDGIDGGIFLEACRINHACDNNAQKSWNKNIKRHTVHALRDISNGEEITVYYLGVHNNRKTRQAALQAKFGFTCSCRLCSLPAEQSQEFDRRLEAIFRLDGLVGQGGAMGIVTSPLQTLRYVDHQVRLYNENGPDDTGLPRAFLDAAQITIANGDLARGRIFAERAVSAWCNTLGEDSTEVIQYKKIAQNPSKHDLYGMSTKWKTTVQETPHGLKPSDFDDWLWRREKLKPQGQLADLRSRTEFPAFIDLPVTNRFDLDFYESSDMVTYQPRRHWCLLGEIVYSGTLARLQMEIEDVDGTKFPLIFYTDDRGNELAPAQIQKGYTVAILYAKYHKFLYDEPGIRHEAPQMLKVL